MYYLIAIAIAALFLTGDTEVPNDKKFDSIFQKYATIYGLDWKMLKTICYIESNLGRAASVTRGLVAPSDVEGSKSSDGLSWGIMQVRITTARDYDPTVTVIKLNDPDYSVKIAAQHLSMLKKYFTSQDQNVVEYVVKAYNQGQGRMQKVINGEATDVASGYWLKYLNIYQGV